VLNTDGRQSMPRTPGSGQLLVRLIVIKKVVIALLLLLVSLAALLSSRHFDQLSHLADLWGQANRELLVQLADQAELLGPTRLGRIALVSGFYAGLILVAAWATWLGRHWGEWLLVAVFVMALPLEVAHVLHEQSPRTVVVLGLTLLGLGLTLRQALGSVSSRRQPR